MKTTIMISFLLTAFFISCGEKNDKFQIADNQRNEMRSNAGEFMKQLMGVLLKQIESGGTVSALNVCSDTAQILTNNFGLKKGVFVKRISFKNRNPNNVPDEFETRGLKEFESKKNEGVLNSDTEHIEITTEDEHKYLRFMKPIFINTLCLRCHGTEENISPEVRETIKQRYPKDKATGYSVGDLRGAISIKKLIE